MSRWSPPSTGRSTSQFSTAHWDFHWAVLRPGSTGEIERLLHRLVASGRPLRAADQGRRDRRRPRSAPPALRRLRERRRGGRRRHPRTSPAPHRRGAAQPTASTGTGVRRCVQQSSADLGSPPDDRSTRDAPTVGAATATSSSTCIAVALNPVDIAIGNGRFYAGHPPLPYVPGVECVGRTVDEQRLVYAQGGGHGHRHGRLRRPAGRRAAVGDHRDPDRQSTPPSPSPSARPGWPAGVRHRSWPSQCATTSSSCSAAPEASAASRCRRHAPRRATDRRRGSLGRAARRLGEFADATVAIDGDARRQASRKPCGQPPTLIIDLLWGDPVVAAVTAAAPGARIVQVGASAGPEAALPSAAIRGKQLDVLGYSNFGLPRPGSTRLPRARRSRQRRDGSRSTSSASPSTTSPRPGTPTATGRAKAVRVPAAGRGARPRDRRGDHAETRHLRGRRGARRVDCRRRQRRRGRRSALRDGDREGRDRDRGRGCRHPRRSERARVHRAPIGSRIGYLVSTEAERAELLGRTAASE